MAPIRITDVAPRDGLQNEPGSIPTADKAALVRLLARTGVDEVEVTSFVSPKWIPQLADSVALLEQLADMETRPVFSALVPNERGMQTACDVLDRGLPLDKIAVFTAASETFSQRNTNASIAETLERFKPVLEEASKRTLPVRGYISCVIECPFEGPIAPAAVAEVADKLLGLGVDEIDIGDTIGAATPSTTTALADALGSIPTTSLTLHLHDTFGRAADCVRAALDAGITSFDASAGGLGGCPYASTPGHRAPGNIATSLLVETCRAAGFDTRVDANALAEANACAQRIVQAARAEEPES